MWQRCNAVKHTSEVGGPLLVVGYKILSYLAFDVILVSFMLTIMAEELDMWS